MERPEYKNWVPLGMVIGLFAAACAALTAFLLLGATGLLLHGAARVVCAILFGAGAAVLLFYAVWMLILHKTFDYNGRRKLSKVIVEGTAAHVRLPDGGVGLDVGCGSGALTIACAKRNPKASFVGIDRWGKEYASFNKPLCENNAKAENVKNVSFRQGDATKLNFADGTFDAVTSNYVYHNIPSGDRQAILLETLRTLKKGGTFALHDLFSKSKYGDMLSFVKKLKSMGYEKVELIDTTSGRFMTPFEAKWMGLSGSALLVGRK